MDEENYPEDLLSNLMNKHRDAALRAMKATGFDLRIEKACDCAGRPLDDMFALHTNEMSRDHGAFWDKFKELAE